MSRFDDIRAALLIDPTLRLGSFIRTKREAYGPTYEETINTSGRWLVDGDIHYRTDKLYTEPADRTADDVEEEILQEVEESLDGYRPTRKFLKGLRGHHTGEIQESLFFYTDERQGVAGWSWPYMALVTCIAGPRTGFHRTDFHLPVIHDQNEQMGDVSAMVKILHSADFSAIHITALDVSGNVQAMGVRFLSGPRAGDANPTDGDWEAVKKYSPISDQVSFGIASPILPDPFPPGWDK